MSEQRPNLWPAAAIAGGFLVLALAMLAMGIISLAAAPISLLLVLWVALPLIGLPLALWSGHQLYGLLTARYRIDRDGFVLRWGFAREQVPLQQVRSVRWADRADLPSPGLQMPGFHLGAAKEGDPEYFAVTGNHLVVVEFDQRRLVISPEDPEAFVDGFVSATRLGSLEPLAAKSQRTQLLPGRLWADPWARWMVLGGLILFLAFIGHLGFMANEMPAEIPFGFSTAGLPGPTAPPGRLLLLALLSGLVWAGNLIMGVWFYPREGQRPLAYGLWGLSWLICGLLWGAVLQMIGAAL
ncbi:MAG: PH domain-containing protein [Anaerolineales bacterium]